VAYSSNIGKTGTTITCLGANQRGKIQAKCSIKTHIHLSKLQEIALCITTGLSFSLFSFVNPKSNLSGRLKSH